MNTSLSSTARIVPTLGWLLTVAALSSFFGGCLYDPDERCGENQEFDEDAELCVCVENAALVDHGCELCAENEEPGEGGCECEDGFERSGSGKCVQGFAGFGEECSDDSDCPENGASRCVSAGSRSFCSLDCESAADCPNPAGCEVAEDDPFCVAAPTGLDEPCTSSDECSGFEADYCETMLENKCKVQCKDDPGVCHGDWACCDYSALIGSALCVSSGDLEEGACPFGGELLEAN